MHNTDTQYMDVNTSRAHNKANGNGKREVGENEETAGHNHNHEPTLQISL